MIRRLKFDKYSALYLWALFMVVFGITTPNFLTWTSAKLVFVDPAVYTGTLALAFLIPMTTGTFDLAIGANMTLSLVITTHLASTTDMPEILTMVIALGACALGGFISGFFIVKLKVNSFIATLGMSQVITAVIQLVSSQSISDAFSDGYRDIGRTEILGLPAYWWYMMIIAVIAWYVLEHTPIGRHMFATGGNPEAARLAGVNTDRLIWSSLVVSGVIAGCAGLWYGFRTGNYNNTVGPGFLFPAVAAVFFGASQLKGRPNVWGTFIALYALAWGIKGLQLNYPTSGNWISPLFYGVSLLAAVSLASHQGVVRVKRRKGDGKEDEEIVTGPAIPAAEDRSTVARPTDPPP